MTADSPSDEEPHYRETRILEYGKTDQLMEDQRRCFGRPVSGADQLFLNAEALASQFPFEYDIIASVQRTPTNRMGRRGPGALLCVPSEKDEGR